MLVSRPQDGGIPETMDSRILVFMRSFGGPRLDLSRWEHQGIMGIILGPRFVLVRASVNTKGNGAILGMDREFLIRIIDYMLAHIHVLIEDLVSSRSVSLPGMLTVARKV